MLSPIIFFVLLSTGLVQAVPFADESCEAQIYNSSSSCSGLITVPRSCQSATANLATTGFKSCDAVDFSWAYPIDNLTIIIETPFTRQHQPYAIHIDNKQFKAYPLPIYRILDGHETEIKTRDDIIVEKSDSKYQIILKLQAETTVSYYVFFFRYNVTKI
jgi:hypothetical protein